MRGKLGLEGVPELIAALGTLTQATQRNQLRAVLKDEIKPLADDVIASAPYRYGDLKENLFIGTRLTKRQRQMLPDKPTTAEIHFGTADPAGMMEEFGLGPHNDPNPFFRPAWEARKLSILEGIRTNLGSRIMAAAARAKRKALKRGKR